MKYKVIESGSSASLAVYVRDAISVGWKPQGGVAVMYNASGYTWAQAMIKDDE